MRFVVGFPPGGPNDLLTRLIAPGIGERLGRSVEVENRAGANGEIAAASVAKAPADGSVFMLGSNGSITIAAALNKSLPYDVRSDFAAVAPVGINPMLLVVRPDLQARNVAELLALARERPGKRNGASAGAGGATHLALELFKSLGRLDIVHVPYKGGGPAMADLMGQHGRPLFRRSRDGAAARQVRQAARAWPDRRAALGRGARHPDPRRVGLPGYEAAISYGVFLPAGAPQTLIDKLHDAVAVTIRSPEVAKKFAELGADPQFGTPSGFARYVADDLVKWARVAKDAGLEVD